MYQKVNLFWKQFRIMVLFPPIFLADTKIIHGYNFVAPLNTETIKNNKHHLVNINKADRS